MKGAAVRKRSGRSVSHSGTLPARPATSSCWQPQMAAVHAVQGQCGRGVCSLRLLAGRCTFRQQCSSSTLSGSANPQQCSHRQQPRRQCRTGRHSAGLPRGCEHQQLQRQCSSSFRAARTAVDRVLAGHRGEHGSAMCRCPFKCPWSACRCSGTATSSQDLQLVCRSTQLPMLQQMLILPQTSISCSFPVLRIDVGSCRACRPAALLLHWKLSQLPTTASMQ